MLARAAAAGVGEMVTIGTTLAQSAAPAGHGRGASEPLVHRRRASAPCGRSPIPTPGNPGRDDAAPEGHRHRRVRAWTTSTTRSPRDVQQENFRAHIRAARLAGVPLAIHARDADDDIATILQEERDRAGGSISSCTASARPDGWPRRQWRWAAMSASPAS